MDDTTTFEKGTYGFVKDSKVFLTLLQITQLLLINQVNLLQVLKLFQGHRNMITL